MYKSLAISPISVVDRNTANRIINAVMVKTYISHNGHKDWAYEASAELMRDFGIDITIPRLRQFLAGLKRGTRDDRSASHFSGKIHTRLEKEGMYREMDTLVSCFLKHKSYVGLPANQLIHVARKYDSVVACEWNEEHLDFMYKMKEFFVPYENVDIIYGDLLTYLQKTDKHFSVYDIDLMTYLNRNGLVEKIVSGIARTTEAVSVVCLVTCGGRKITLAEYALILPEFISALQGCGVEIIHHQSGHYIDQIIPMNYELLVIKREQ